MAESVEGSGESDNAEGEDGEGEDAAGTARERTPDEDGCVLAALLALDLSDRGARASFVIEHATDWTYSNRPETLNDWGSDVERLASAQRLVMLVRDALTRVDAGTLRWARVARAARAAEDPWPSLMSLRSQVVDAVGEARGYYPFAPSQDEDEDGNLVPKVVTQCHKCFGWGIEPICRRCFAIVDHMTPEDDFENERRLAIAKLYGSIEQIAPEFGKIPWEFIEALLQRSDVSDAWVSSALSIKCGAFGDDVRARGRTEAQKRKHIAKLYQLAIDAEKGDEPEGPI